MSDVVHRLFTTVSTPRALWILFFAGLAAILAFQVRNHYAGADPPDGKFGYTRSELTKIFDDMEKKGGRPVYSWTQITLDFAFPAIYASFFGGLMAAGFSSRRSRWLLLLPLAAAFLDLRENVLLAWLCCRHTTGMDHGAAATVAMLLTSSKLILCILSLLLAFYALGLLCLRPSKAP